MTRNLEHAAAWFRRAARNGYQEAAPALTALGPRYARNDRSRLSGATLTFWVLIAIAVVAASYFITNNQFGTESRMVETTNTNVPEIPTQQPEQASAPIVSEEAITQEPPASDMTPAPDGMTPLESVLIEDPVWIDRPTQRDFERYFPRRALNRGINGEVVLECVAASTGDLHCTVAEETPEGWQFGQAALRLSGEFKLAPTLADGRPVESARLRLPISFRAE